MSNRRSFEERRRETNARYYQNKKARQQGQTQNSSRDWQDEIGDQIF